MKYRQRRNEANKGTQGQASLIIVGTERHEKIVPINMKGDEMDLRDKIFVCCFYDSFVGPTLSELTIRMSYLASRGVTNLFAFSCSFRSKLG